MEAEGRRKGLKIAVLLVVLVIVAIILLTPSVQNAIANFLLSPFQQSTPKYVTYRLERTLSVDANGGEVDSFTLDIPVPQGLGGNGYNLQTMSSITTSPQADQILRFGKEWLEWEHGGLTGSQTYTVKATYEFRVDTHIWELDAAASGTLDDIPISLRVTYNHNEWLSDEGWKIDLTDQTIAQKSEEIVGQEENVFLILSQIYHWVVDNVRYSSVNIQGEPKTSRDTLASLEGDCDDQALLFCSLARAAGVPAWPQLGALYDKSKDTWFGHGWVQAYVPLKEGGSETVVIDTVNRDFLLWMPNRIAEYTDDGNGEHLSDYYYSFNYYYDANTYPTGSGPLYEETYRSLAHEESADSVNIGSIFQDLKPQPLEIMPCQMVMARAL